MPLGESVDRLEVVRSINPDEVICHFGLNRFTVDRGFNHRKLRLCSPDILTSRG